MADYENGETLHATGSLNMSLTGERAFEAYCRQAGTRINAMFEAIERGETDRDIAGHFRTDCETVRVYRAVLSRHKSDGVEPQSSETNNGEKVQTGFDLEMNGAESAQSCRKGNDANSEGIEGNGRASRRDGKETRRCDTLRNGEVNQRANTVCDGNEPDQCEENGNRSQKYNYEKAARERAKERASEVRKLQADGLGISRIAKRLWITRAEVMRILKNE